MASSDEVRAKWTGHDLFDLNGERIGTIEDVSLGEAQGEPAWLVVRKGVFATKRIYVPVSEVRESGDRLSVMHTKDRVDNAPDTEEELVLRDSDKGKLCRYYGVQYLPPVSGAADGCSDMQDLRPGG